ncbi:MAG TPA: hypothetical protein VJI74_02780 [Candidatus Paceibacterota bacterium]
MRQTINTWIGIVFVVVLGTAASLMIINMAESGHPSFTASVDAGELLQDFQ